MQKSILLFLKKITPLPKEIKEKINEEKEIELLQRQIQIALEVQSLEEFVVKIQQKIYFGELPSLVVGKFSGSG